MSTDPRTNPYAPPAAPERPSEPEPEGGGRRRRDPDFEAERRSVVLCILLGIVTLQLYSAIWLWKRRPFIDSFDTVHRDKLVRLPEALVVLWCANVVVPFFGKEAATVENMVSLAFGICTLIANFTVARALRAELTRSGRLLEVSSALTFFFGIFYLQYKINEAADTPPRGRRKKKRKKKVEAADAEPAGPEDEKEPD